MKKIITSLMIILLLLVGGISFYTVDAETGIELNLTGTTAIKQDDKTLTLTLSLGNFTEISDNCVLGYEAVLDYDESVFESVTVRGLNGWSSSYENSTKILIGDTASAKANTSITEIVFTLKEGIQPTTTDIQLKNIILTNDDNDFEFNKKITVAIQGTDTPKPSDDETKGDSEKPSEKENKTPADNTTPDKTVTSKDNTIANKKIPAAGYQSILLIIAISVLIIGALSLIRYKSIKLK